MNRKLIFLDIDGTLLPPGDMLIPDSTLQALRAARANGHKLFLCTGRNLRMTAPLLEYGCFDGAICSAGGYVLCDGQVLVDLPMEPEQCSGLSAVLEQHGVDYTLESRDDAFAGPKMTARWKFTADAPDKPLNSEAARWRKAMQDGMRLTPLSRYDGQPIYKIVYIAEHLRDLDEAKRLYQDQFVFCESNLDTMDDGMVNGELINRKFDKGTGIRAICRHLGHPQEDTIGFGDSDNDLQMTQAAGIAAIRENDYFMGCCQTIRKNRTDTIAQLRAMGLQLALASSSPMSNIRQVLGECGLMEFFPVLVSGEQFEASKPDPEIYLHTMARLGRRPEECLIVEDSTYGVQAGAAAGGLVAALRDERFPFDQSAARFHIGNLSEIPALAASIQ